MPVLLSAIVFYGILASVRSLVVRLDEGDLEGFVHRTVSGKEIYSFLGVPYAEPPVGSQLRFKEPTPRVRWDGTWIATRAPNICMQYNRSSPTRTTGSEDCLYLNIYVPTDSSHSQSAFKPLFDVVVYFHGGGYYQGSANYHGPDYLLDRENVILVTVNYRLGVLGFLTLRNEYMPANLGLKDQYLALKWVKKNIAHFGGDPNKVTIVGCSAGGASVHMHVLSPLSKGLFQKAIILSGVALNPWAIDSDPKAKAFKVAEAVGCSGYVLDEDYDEMNSASLAACLKDRPAEALVAQIELFEGWLEYDGAYPGPVIETPSPTAFIDSPPEDIIRSGRATDIPLLFGYTNDEALFITAEILSNKTKILEMESNWTRRLSLINYYNLEGSNHNKIAHAVKDFYLGGKSILESPGMFTKMFSDCFFVAGIQRAAKMHAEHSKSPVFAYVFSHKGEKRYSDYYNLSGIYEGGAVHGDDLYYVIKTDYLVKRDGNKTEEAMSNAMIDLWMGFIKNQGSLSIPNFPTWEPLNENLPNFVYLNVSNVDMAENKFEVDDGTNISFWTSLEMKTQINKMKRDEL